MDQAQSPSEQRSHIPGNRRRELFGINASAKPEEQQPQPENKKREQNVHIHGNMKKQNVPKSEEKDKRDRLTSNRVSDYRRL